MQNSPLVSIITPCHNSRSFIHRLLDSILEQTYPNIEMYAMDNASKDDTADIIKSYIPRFAQRGYSLKYILEEDLGPSGAVQNALGLIKGDYLVMPDSDDWYAEKDSIEKYVNIFESLSDDYAIVRAQLQHVRESDMEKLDLIYANFPEDDPGTLFEDCLFGKNNYCYAPINYMVKVSKLREMTGMSIYNAYNTGQQRQICLPLYYKYKAWTISEPLACYLVRESSISHGDYSKYPTQKVLYYKSINYIESILKTIDSMPDLDKTKYRNAFMRQSAMRILMLSLRCNKTEDVCGYIKDYRRFGGGYDVFFTILKFKTKLFLKNLFV
ncbi:MAG: glycosyltransferase family 2 protein [Bacteroidales bacterium]|nr:glycosyltransferase family 2 protein [Candidatus Physcocola equi]